jgi:succinate dehydrogenase / fumarate reductase flavoprotein subunit
MGKFAGQKILEYLNEFSKTQPEQKEQQTFLQFSSYLNAGGKDNFGQIRNAMRTLMTTNVGIFRTAAGISDAIEALKELQDRAQKTALSSSSLMMNQELVQRWELDNLLAVSMVISRAALNRRESRGAHYREDFPTRQDEFNHHTLALMAEFGKVELAKRSVDMSIFEAGNEYSKKFGIIERKY